MTFTKKRKNLEKRTKRTIRFRKSAAAGCMLLALTASCLSAGNVMAGPADDPALSTQTGGPGQGDGDSTAVLLPPAVVYVNPNYYDAAISNAIVNPVDKYSYEQMEQDILALQSRYPNRVTVNVIGKSLDDRNIYDVIVGSPRASKQILFQGAIHAREYITVPLMMQQMEYLLANYDTGYYHDQTLSSLLQNTAIHFVPMANPDGVALSQFGDTAIRSDFLRQVVQTCYMLDAAEGLTGYAYPEYLTRWKSNGRGVDLNHNFNAGWEGLNPTLNHNSATNFKGEAPLSEPEAQALDTLSNQYGFSAVVNYHAMGNVIYWDTLDNKTAESSLTLAAEVAAETGYQVLGSKGVGGFKDWLQRKDKPSTSITIEIGRSTCPVSFSEYPAIWNQNKGVIGVVAKFTSGR